MATRYFTILLFLLAPLRAEIHPDAPKDQPKGLIAVGPIHRTKLGENLWVLTQSWSYQMSGVSKMSCSIGYNEEKDDGEDFIPVIIFPVLENDEYEIVMKDGVICVSKEKSKSEVIRIDSALLRPSCEGLRNNLKRVEFGKDIANLPKKDRIQVVEPAGADQPATKPADKAPGKNQPSTPTSKDAPR